MARAKRSKTKPVIKSSAQKVPKIGWGQSNKNVNTIRKLEQAQNNETDFPYKEVDVLLNDGYRIAYMQVCSNPECGSDNIQERSGSKVCFSCGHYQ